MISERLSECQVDNFASLGGRVAASARLARRLRLLRGLSPHPPTPGAWMTPRQRKAVGGANCCPAVLASCCRSAVRRGRASPHRGRSTTGQQDETTTGRPPPARGSERAGKRRGACEVCPLSTPRIARPPASAPHPSRPPPRVNCLAGPAGKTGEEVVGKGGGAGDGREEERRQDACSCVSASSRATTRSMWMNILRMHATSATLLFLPLLTSRS